MTDKDDLIGKIFDDAVAATQPPDDWQGSLTAWLLKQAEEREGDSAYDDAPEEHYDYSPCIFEEADGMTTYPNGDRLPGIWITVPLRDGEGNPVGRDRVMRYPLPSFYDELFPGEDPDDADSELALHYGACYYDEGMSYTDANDRDKRIECFQAVELLYRHSAGHGNAVANLCLGYIYSYDRCEGRYWRDYMTLKTKEDYERPYPREERAFGRFAKAAEAGIPEACYKLGDPYKHGVACEPDAKIAYGWYIAASKLATQGNEPPAILGSIALRLAGCYEEGLGCGQSFERALEWYVKAVSGLGFAVDNGEAWYARRSRAPVRA